MPDQEAERLFELDEIEEVPLLRPMPRRRSQGDVRFRGEYPLDWNRCTLCGGNYVNTMGEPCPRCLGMGSVKARVRLEADHRCLRCQHPYIPKADAKILGKKPSWRPEGWSNCDERCVHKGPIRAAGELLDSIEDARTLAKVMEWKRRLGEEVPRVWIEAQWRVLTVHHADGDKANLAWWNLLALCQRCHLEIQHKVVMERIWPHEHSAWFKPFVAGYYAWVYLGEQLPREETMGRLEELLALERAA